MKADDPDQDNLIEIKQLHVDILPRVQFLSKLGSVPKVYTAVNDRVCRNNHSPFWEFYVTEIQWLLCRK